MEEKDHSKESVRKGKWGERGQGKKKGTEGKEKYKISFTHLFNSYF